MDDNVKGAGPGENRISSSDVIISTAIKTLFYIIVFSSLIAVILAGAFPFRAMKLFDSLGLERRALDMTEIYIRRNDKDRTAMSEYVDGLIYKMSFCESLLDQSSDRKSYSKYAAKLYDSTFDYASVAGIELRNELLDKNNIIGLATYAHPLKYSYKDYIYTRNYTMGLLDNKYDIFLHDAKYKGISEMMSLLEAIDQSSLSFDRESGERPEVMLEYSVFFNQLSSYIASQLYRDPDGGGLVDFWNFSLFTVDNYRLLDLLEEKLVYFRDYAAEYDQTHSASTDKPALLLEQLYFFRAVSVLIDDLCAMTQQLGYRHQEWAAINKTDVFGSVYDDKELLEIYIEKLIPQYDSIYYLYS